MIAARQLTSIFGDTIAVDRLTFQVPAGKVCSLLGPNGAGKSTTIKMLAGMLPPSSRVALICDFDVTKQTEAVKRRIGVLPEGFGHFDDLTVYEHLYLTGDLYGLATDVVETHVNQLVKVLDFSKARSTLIRNCSHGTRQKTALAVALLTDPHALLLDEPFEVVDPKSSCVVQRLIAGAVRRGVTVFLTSHIFSAIERVVHQFLIIRDGTITLNSSREELTKPLEEVYFCH